MVLERMKGVLTWAIDRYLGSIVTNVDSDALKTDLWRGNVELHGLQLRDDVLQSAGIPCVVSGTIRMAGVNASRDGSVKLTIAGVHAVVTPLVGDAARDVRLRELKEEDIRRCIAAALEGEGGGGGGGAEGGAEGAAGEGGAPAQGYLAQRISDTLMENIQLTVTDVQISYDHGPRPLPAALACALPALLVPQPVGRGCAGPAGEAPISLQLNLSRLSVTEAPPGAEVSTAPGARLKPTPFLARLRLSH